MKITMLCEKCVPRKPHTQRYLHRPDLLLRPNRDAIGLRDIHQTCRHRGPAEILTIGTLEPHSMETVRNIAYTKTYPQFLRPVLVSSVVNLHQFNLAKAVPRSQLGERMVVK